MGLANDYDTEPADDDVAGSDDEGISSEQYAWLQEQLAQLGELRVDDDEEEEEWVDPSGGLLTNVYAACEEGDADKLASTLSELQETQYSIDTPGPDGDTALHLACLFGHHTCAALLITSGCQVVAVNSEDSSTPLHDAAAGGYLQIVQLLLEKGGPGLLPVQDSDGDTALHNSARGGHVEVVRYLLQQGADPCVRNQAGKTAAAEAEDTEVVAALVRAAQQRLAAAAATPTAAATAAAKGDQ